MVEKVLQLNRGKTIFWTLLGIFFLCAGFYMYFINSTVHNVVTRQNMEKEAGQLALKIGSEEFQYITMRNAITLPLAYSLGFKNVSVKTFVSRDASPSVAYAPRGF